MIIIINGIKDDEVKVSKMEEYEEFLYASDLLSIIKTISSDKMKEQLRGKYQKKIRKILI